MKKVLLFVFICMSVPVLHAQICDEEDLSLEGLAHYKKAIEYSKNLTSGTHDKALAEWERVIRTDSLWCDEVYKRTGILCEYLYANKKPTGQIVYRDKAIRYYRTYLAFNPSDKDIIGRLSELESQSDINKNSINNSVKIEMVYVEGMLNEDTTGYLHSFYMGKYEVTQQQWQSVMGINPSHFKGPNLPVEHISYDEAILFVKELNRITGSNYRIPTVKEWEYAAHGGNNQEKYTYAGGYAYAKVGWSEDNSGGRTHSVGEKEPNSLDLFDMSGNVAEICIDSSMRVGRVSKVYKGGSWKQPPTPIDYSEDYSISDFNRYDIGLRLVMPEEELSEQEKSWERMIAEKKQRLKSEEDRMTREKERIEQEYERKDSFCPIIRLTGVLGVYDVGYDFSKRNLVMNAIISPGPIYASALLTDEDSLFSGGIKLRFINRIDLMLGVAYAPRKETFGGDVGLYYSWNNLDISAGLQFFPYNSRFVSHIGVGYCGIRVGAIQYNNQIIPTLGIRIDKTKWKQNISPIYGYDIKDNNHLLGFNCFAGPVFASAMYQFDTNYHVSAGLIGTLFDGSIVGFRGGIAYSSVDRFGLDAGLTFSFGKESVNKGNISMGVLVYKNKIIPTIGLGGNAGFGILGTAGLAAMVVWCINQIFQQYVYG